MPPPYDGRITSIPKMERTGICNTFLLNVGYHLQDLAIAQAVSSRSLAAEFQVRTGVSPWGFMVDKLTRGQGFLRVLLFRLSV
jgi:hypothetical protein